MANDPGWDRRWPVTLLTRPYHDFMAGFEASLDRGTSGLVAVLGGLLVGWWVYVPIHELFHAWACLALGGTVETLEIAPHYGGTLLAQVIPFVEAGGEYAGRLSGFDTGGCDGVYLGTVFGPYLLTLFPGIWALLTLGRRAAGSLAAAIGFGAAMPAALAPFISLTGDAYEMGSILVTRLPPWVERSTLLRGDDLFLVAKGVSEAGGATGAWIGLVLAAILGLVWAFLTYACGGWLADRLMPRGDS